MNAFHQTLGDPAIQRLGWTLLHFLWQGMIVAGLAAIGLRLLSRKSAQARYLNLTAALLIMAVCPVATFILTGPYSPVENENPRRIATATNVIMRAGLTRVEIDDRTKHSEYRKPQPSKQHGFHGVAAGTQHPFIDRGDSKVTLWATLSSLLQPILPWIVVAWLLGVSMLGVRLAGGWWMVMRWKRESVRPRCALWEEAAKRLCDTLKIRCTVRLLESTLANVPMAVGWMRPVILFPASVLTGLRPAEVESLIAHELAHIRRHDFLVNLFQNLIETLLFYHPAVWWVSRRIRRERENCCDDLAVELVGDRLVYARALLSMAALHVATPSLVTAANGDELTHRIRRLLGLTSPATCTASGWTAGTTVLLVAAGVAAMATANGFGKQNDKSLRVAGTGDQISLNVAQQSPSRVKPARQRVLKFAKDRSLGIVYTRPFRSGGYDTRESYIQWKQMSEARGDVSVPANAEVRLDVGLTGSRDLSSLATLDPDALYGMRLDSTDLNDDGLRHIGRLTGLQWLSLRSTRISDAGIAHLKSLKNLREIELSAYRVNRQGYGVGDNALAVLGSLPALEDVGLRLTKVTDAGLKHLSNAQSLRHLGIEGTKVTDAGMLHLRKLPDLETLRLGAYRDGAPITDKGLQSIGELTNLKNLSLSGTQVSNEGLISLKGLTNLESLSLDNTKVTQAGLAHLKPLKSLQSLRFYIPVTDEGAAHLAELKALRSLSSNLEVTDKGVALLSQLPNLESLSLTEGVTDESIRHIARMKSLNKLWFQRCPITDAGIAPLKNLKSLRYLTIRDTRMTGEGLRHLAELPNLEILRVQFGEDAIAKVGGRIDLEPLRNLKSLKNLKLSPRGIRNEDLAHVGKLTQLEVLELTSAPAATELMNEVDDEGIRHLAGLTALTALKFDETTVTDAGLAALANMPRLEYLNISGHFTDTGLKQLHGLQSLTRVSLASPLITDEGVNSLSVHIPKLQSLNRIKFLVKGHAATFNRSDGFFRAGSPDNRSKLVALEGHTPPVLNVTGWINTDAKKLKLSDLKGQVVLLEFCYRPRRAALPRLKQIYNRYRSQGLVIAGILTMYDADQLAEFVKNESLPWPMAVDVEKQTATAFHMNSYQLYYLIDRSGTLRFAGLHEAELERAVQHLVSPTSRSQR